MPKNKLSFFMGFFIIPALLFTFLLTAQIASAACEPSDEAALTDCVEACPEGDQGCIDSCCFDWPDCECPAPEACPPEDQADLDECMDSCDPGDQGCIDSCCFDWPDCECREADACDETAQGLLDECIEACDPGDQGCIDSCCFDWPDCECPEPEEDGCTPQNQADLDACMDSCDPGNQACIDSCCFDWPDCECREPTCIDNLKACHQSCTDPGCFAACDQDFQECSTCFSYVRCHDFFCDPADTACQNECDQLYAHCLDEDIPDDYGSCYEDCFENFQDHDDVIACIEDCQEQYPDPDREPPYELIEPRCFTETNFFDYEDVPAEAWFWSPINFLTRLEIPEGSGTGINSATFHSRIVRGYNRDDEDDSKLKPGMTKDIFLPFRDLNRFEASKIATLVSCYTIPDTQADISKPMTFSDLAANSDEYMNRVIYRTAEVGLVEGYNDGSFKPFQPITRAEFLKVFLTVGEFDVHNQTYANSGFSDVTDPNVWYYPYVAFAKHNDVPIIGGYEDGTFKPNNPIARNEAMKIITNTMFALDWISK
jgi:hypothetical protein